MLETKLADCAPTAQEGLQVDECLQSLRSLIANTLENPSYWLFSKTALGSRIGTTQFEEAVEMVGNNFPQWEAISHREKPFTTVDIYFPHWNFLPA